MSKKFFKILPLKPSIAQRCGVCDELLVIPPIYSCKSVPFICGPCFEGYRYYLDDDELRAVDNPIRQMLYENFARNVRFPCAYYPHCTAEMTFDNGARLHYKEFCFAKLLWIFRCPISRANRWFLRPDQLYCDWRYKRIDLFDDDSAKMMKHLRHLHSEYILEKPYVLKLRDLKNFERNRQLFLLLIEETNVIAVLLTEITLTDIVFRCRVNDYVETKTASHDPYECCITLIPPNERFTSMIDIKFECVRFDSNDVEYPWQALRLPLRHLIEETSFKIFVLPRSLMLRSMPYLHRDRQLLKAIEDGSSEATLSTPECGMSASDATMSVEESDKTDIELLSLASSSSDKKSDEYTEDPLDLCEIKLGELEDISTSEKWHCKRATHLVFLPNTSPEAYLQMGEMLTSQSEKIEPEITSDYMNIFRNEFDNTEFSSSKVTPLELDSNIPSFLDSPEDLPQLIEVFPSEYSKNVRFGRIKKKSTADNYGQFVETPRNDSREPCKDCEQSENPSSYHPEDDQTIPGQFPERITSPFSNQQTDLAFDVSRCSPESSQLNSWTDSELNMLTLLSIPDGPTVENSLHNLIDLITSKMITEEWDETTNKTTPEKLSSHHQTETELVQEKAFLANSTQLNSQIDVSKQSSVVHFISTADQKSNLPSIPIPDDLSSTVDLQVSNEEIISENSKMRENDETKKKAAVTENASQEDPNDYEKSGSPSSNFAIDAKPIIIQHVQEQATAAVIPSKDSIDKNNHSLLSMPDIPAILNSLHNLIGLNNSKFSEKLESNETKNISTFEDVGNRLQNMETILPQACSRYQQSKIPSSHKANETALIQELAALAHTTSLSKQIKVSKKSPDVHSLRIAAKEFEIPSISFPDDPPSKEDPRVPNEEIISENSKMKVKDETENSNILLRNIENILSETYRRHQQSTISFHQAKKTDQIQEIATQFSNQIDDLKQSSDDHFVSTTAEESKLSSISLPDEPPSTEDSQVSNEQITSEVNDETRRESIPQGHQKVNQWPMHEEDLFGDISKAQLKKDEGFDEKKNSEGISDSEYSTEGILVNCLTSEEKISPISISIDDDPFEPMHSIPSEHFDIGDEQLNIGALQLVCSGLKEKREYSEKENDFQQEERGTENTAQKIQLVKVDVSTDENNQEKAQEIIQRDIKYKYANTTTTVIENGYTNSDCQMETNYLDENNGTPKIYTSILDCLRSPEGN